MWVSLFEIGYRLEGNSEKACEYVRSRPSLPFSNGISVPYEHLPEKERNLFSDVHDAPNRGCNCAVPLVETIEFLKTSKKNLKALEYHLHISRTNLDDRRITPFIGLDEPFDALVPVGAILNITKGDPSLQKRLMRDFCRLYEVNLSACYKGSAQSPFVESFDEVKDLSDVYKAAERSFFDDYSYLPVEYASLLCNKISDTQLRVICGNGLWDKYIGKAFKGENDLAYVFGVLSRKDKAMADPHYFLSRLVMCIKKRDRFFSALKEEGELEKVVSEVDSELRKNEGMRKNCS